MRWWAGPAVSGAVEAVEVGEYGGDAAVGVVGLDDVELGEDVPDVCLDGAFAHHETTSDPRVGKSFRHESQHGTFPFSEVGQQTPYRLVWPIDQISGKYWLDNDFTCSDTYQRVGEYGHPGDLVLEPVPDPLSTDLK